MAIDRGHVIAGADLQHGDETERRNAAEGIAAQVAAIDGKGLPRERHAQEAGHQPDFPGAAGALGIVELHGETGRCISPFQVGGRHARARAPLMFIRPCRPDAPGRAPILHEDKEIAFSLAGAIVGRRKEVASCMTRHIVAIGQLPPPLNGFSFATKSMIALLSEANSVTVANIAPPLGKLSLLKHP